MTDVLVRLTAPSSGAAASGWVPADEVAAVGHLECRPYAPDADGARQHLEGPDRLLLPASMPPVRLVAGEALLHLAPTGAGWCWQIIERTPRGKTRYVLVPDSAATLDYGDLVDVDPATLAPTAEPEAAWWAAIEGIGLNTLTDVDTTGQSEGDVLTLGPLGEWGPAALDLSGYDYSDFGAAALSHSHAPEDVTGTAVITTDARLSDARTPLAHSHTLADVTDAGDAAGLDVGTTAGTVMAGDDSRVTSLPSTYVRLTATLLDHGVPPDLDTLAVGYWRQGYATDGTLVLHYPSDNWYGNILVMTSGTVTEQRAVKYNGVTHTRTKTGSTWTAWVPAIPPTGTTAGTYAAGDDSRFLPIPVANLVANGDFTGTTGWTATGAANAAASNVLSNTGDGTAATPVAKTSLPTAFKVGHVMYYKFDVRVTNSACSRIQVAPSSNYGGSGGNSYIDNPVANQWIQFTYSYVTPNYTTPNTVLNFPIGHVYADAATASGKVMQVKYALILDLTDIFGAGREPSLAEMNALLDKYTAKWFGTTPTSLTTVDDLRRNRIDRANVRPTADWSAFLEHEYRTSALDARVGPKLFSIDMGNAIYSSGDHGKNWTREVTLDVHPTFQVTNMNRRMLLQIATNGGPDRDARLRIYDLQYRPISELTNIHGIYGCHSMDGKPGDDNTFVYAEYVVGGDAVNGVRIMQTTDAGVTWTATLSGTGVTHFHTCRFDPFNRTHVYATSGDAGAAFNNRWYKSTDSGATWTLIAGGTVGSPDNTGQTPLIGGTWGDGKYLRTTNTVMGANLGTKARNSIYFFTDNDPCAFVRFDKTLGQFQIIADNLPGVAYGAILTKDGIFTMVEAGGSTSYDTLHFIKFPALDADIDNPAKYAVHTVRMPYSGNKMRQNWSRQQDTAGGIFVGAYGISNQGLIGASQLRPNAGIASKISLGWTSTPLQTATLTITAAATATGLAYVWLNGSQFSVNIAAGDTAIQVAGKIRAATFTGYTAGGTAGTDTVTFTATSPTDLLTDYWPMATGAAGLMRDSSSRLVVGVEPIMSVS